MKHIHFIGICGVAMSALAIAFQKKGYKVTGSDVGFYPPVSTMLTKSGVEFYPGWHPEKMLGPSGELPDLVIVGNVASSTNPEWLAVQAKKIPYQSYPEAIADFLCVKNQLSARERMEKPPLPPSWPGFFLN
jgi:UDP-N-acetylmuramate: L-alanyl-gamma-D-glutamyl-meso-diaminopimelate ligase